MKELRLHLTGRGYGIIWAGIYCWTFGQSFLDLALSNEQHPSLACTATMNRRLAKGGREVHVFVVELDYCYGMATTVTRGNAGVTQGKSEF